jgi:AcrR family transcriptional regulator
MDEKNKDRFSQPDQSARSEDRPYKTRRRGKALENAILQVAWDELNEVGYAHMTMEGVAVRSKTNKTAVYRRWPNKSSLVIAVLHKHAPKIDSNIPDTGSLRGDVLTLLRRITVPAQVVGAETIHGLMLEHLGTKIIASLPHMRSSKAAEKWNDTMTTILKNAEMRGEINRNKISPRVISLPMDLLRYEFLTTQEPVSDETLIEFIDDIFLPLVYLSIHEG